MALLTHQSFANDKTPYWLSNPVEFLRFSGTPDVNVSNVGGELIANGVSMSPSTWYQYPADGNILMDTAGNILQVISNDLYFNNELIAKAGQISNVSDWYLYPAISGNVDLNAGVGISFDGRLLTRSGNDLFFGGVNLNSSEWSRYSALQDVNIANYKLSNVRDINQTSNMTMNVGSNLTVNARNMVNNSYFAVNNNCTTFNVVTDTINPAGDSKINLTATNGTGGEINMIADSSITGSIGGRISMVAEGGNTGGLVYGGLVEIIANTGGILPTGFTSAIKMSAASILSYAGAVSPFGSVAGFNFVYGTGGVNICAGTPPLLPNVPGSVYLTGDIGILGSSGGVRVKNGMSVDWITPFPLAGNLKITGNPAGLKVELSNVASLAMEGDITGLGNISMTGNIGGVSTIVMVGTGGAISNVSTINGFPYNPVRNWANFPAIGDVDMSNHRISNVDQLLFKTTNPTIIPGLDQVLGFAGAEAECVGTIVFGSNGNFRCKELILNSSPTLTDDVKIANISNSYDSKYRLLVINPQPAEVVAYLSDIPKSHGNMSSSVSQGMTVSNVPMVFTYDTFGTLEGITESGGKIYSTNGGSYLMTFSIQFTRISGGTASVAEVWIRQNGVDVPNSSSRALLPGGANNGETIMTVPINLEMAAGGYVEVVFATLDWTNTVATAFPARTTPWTAPAAPCIIVNMDQVG